MSAQCMALVRDNCLLPTKDAPELGYVRESSDKQFVPDVYYKVSFCFQFFFLSYKSNRLHSGDIDQSAETSLGITKFFRMEAGF